MEKQNKSMLNLYEILEVSEKASKEIIDKAYKVLAKKYHPDLQPPEKKQSAELKMKQINEAYKILSDTAKRKEYDLTLMKQKENEINKQIEKKYYERVENNKDNIKNNNEVNYQEMQKEKEQIINNQKECNENIIKLQNEMNRTYTQAYDNYLRNLRIQIKRALDMETIYEFSKSTYYFSNYYSNNMDFSTNS